MVWNASRPDTLAPNNLNCVVTGPCAVASLCSGDICRGQQAPEVRRDQPDACLHSDPVETMGAVGEEGLALLKELGHIS